VVTSGASPILGAVAGNARLISAPIPLESGISERVMAAEHFIEFAIAIAIAVLVARFLLRGPGK
jgi:hypothetical protein